MCVGVCVYVPALMGMGSSIGFILGDALSYITLGDPLLKEIYNRSHKGAPPKDYMYRIYSKIT